MITVAAGPRRTLLLVISYELAGKNWHGKFTTTTRAIDDVTILPPLFVYLMVDPVW